MPHLARQILQILFGWEVPLTAAALMAFLRLPKQVRLPAMCSYLAVRLATATLLVALVYGVEHAPAWSRVCGRAYLCLWILNILILLWLVYRTAAAALHWLLEPLRGLQSLALMACRWMMFVAALLISPVLVALVERLMHRQDIVLSIMRLNRAISMAELLPIVFTIAVAAKRKLSPKSWLLGILIGLCCEPVASLFQSWIWDPHFWGWVNLRSQIVTDATLILWTIWFLLPGLPVDPASPADDLLRWDQLARRNLNLQVAADSEKLASVSGARSKGAIACGLNPALPRWNEVVRRTSQKGLPEGNALAGAALSRDLLGESKRG